MNAQLIVNDFELDLSSSVAVPLNFAIADIKEPQKRRRSFSKSIALEGTQNNLNYFVSAYALPMNLEESTTISFRPNEKQNCKYFKDGLLVFSGKFKLNEVTINNGMYTFDCTLYSDTVDYFAKLKDKKLSELDWSEYDHSLTKTNIANSWDTSIQKNSISVRNFGADSVGYQPKGFGYIYPLVDYGYTRINQTTFKVTDLAPFVYVKECVEKIFRYALENTGYTIDLTSGVFASANFNKLIYGFGGGDKLKLPASEIAKMRMYSQGSYPSKILWGVFNKTFDGGFYTFGEERDMIKGQTFTSILETNNTISDVFGRININAGGSYKLEFSMDFVNSMPFAGNYVTGSKVTIVIFIDGTQTQTQDIKVISTGTTAINFSTTLALKPGNKITIKTMVGLKYIPTTAVDSMSTTYSFQNIAIDLTADSNSAPVDGSTINLSTYIPDIKCSEFLTGIMNMFYLYVSDPIANVITIGTLQDFYQDEALAEDWSDKVDDKRDIKIQSNAFVEGSNYIFRYNEEKDYFNNEYKNITGNSYGRYDLHVDTWQTGDREWVLPFSQYLPIKIENSELRVIRVIEQQNGVVKPYKGKGMIMYYNGLRSGNCVLMNEDTSSSLALIGYPFIHHFRFKNENSYITPEFDIHFSSRSYTFDGIQAYPSINLFTKYHEKFVNELTSIDSKLVNLYMHLKSKDIYSLDFSTLKKIDGVLYRLNLIKDFDSDAFESTEVELLKYLR